MTEIIPSAEIKQLRVGMYAAASLPVCAEGTILYDTTNHKLVIRCAAAWETITSA